MKVKNTKIKLLKYGCVMQFLENIAGHQFFSPIFNTNWPITFRFDGAELFKDKIYQ